MAQGDKDSDVMNYKPPVGPTNINDAATPGLKGTNFECYGTQGPNGTMPKVGRTPMRYPDGRGNSGSQGRR